MKTSSLTINSLFTTRLNFFLYSLAFSLPIFISHPQWVTGTIVNCLLYVAASKMSKKHLYPLLLLPSLGAVTRGILFGPQTVFLYYFLPFIWLGNYLLTLVFSATDRQSFVVRITTASLAKYLLLILSAKIYFSLHLVPQLFLASMGLMQLVTALTGGLLAFFFLQFLHQYERS